MSAVKKEKKLIGRVERVNFPDWEIIGIDAKIDTGAFTSVLHCHDIKKVVTNGKKILSFKLLDPTHPRYNQQKMEFSKFSVRHIKNSFGQVEKRYKIKTKVSLGKMSYKAEFTLTDRRKMKYPVLLGRKVLKEKFIVDVSKRYLLNKKKV